MHEFCHGQAKTIIFVFFVVFGHYQKFKQWPQGFIFQHWMALLQQMKHSGKLNNFMNFFSYHAMCQLGINNLLATRCNYSLVLGMLTNFGVKPIPFFHIRPHIPHNFLTTCMLTKGIPLNSKYIGFSFYLNTNPTNPTFDSMQGSIFLTNNSAHGSCAAHFS
jgi:hypothetical protein